MPINIVTNDININKRNNLVRFRLSGHQFYNVCKLIEEKATNESKFMECNKTFIEKHIPDALKLNHDDYITVRYMTAYGTNLALCIELFLKFILLYDDSTIKKIHNLDKLYCSLSKKRSEEIEHLFTTLHNKTEMISNKDIIGSLVEVSKCAVDWRYLENGSRYNPEFMFKFATVLDNVTESLYNK